MIEPTETEAKETLDEFCDALISICREAKETPDLLHDAPHSQVVGRLDETAAVKNLDVRWRPGKSIDSPSGNGHVRGVVAPSEKEPMVAG